MGPCSGDVGLGGRGGVNRSESVGRFDEVRAEAAAGWRAACVGTGWSVEAATAASVRAEETGPGC